MPSEGRSVLDAMVSGVMAQKAAAGPKGSLTQTKGEAPAPLVSYAKPIPNHPVVGSLPQDPDIVLAKLAEARKVAEHAAGLIADVLNDIAILEQSWGAPLDALAGEAARDAALIQKEKERRADEAAKAAAGDARAAERVEKEKPIEAVEAAVAARIDKKAMLIAELHDDIDADEAESFADRQKRIAAEAQAAVFTTAAPQPAQTDGWVCPEHGEFMDTVSPKGRKFRKCTVCKQFEK